RVMYDANSLTRNSRGCCNVLGNAVGYGNDRIGPPVETPQKPWKGAIPEVCQQFLVLAEVAMNRNHSSSPRPWHLGGRHRDQVGVVQGSQQDIGALPSEICAQRT